ncbi:MAG: hypothetical protein KKD77_21200 [Gammaproteobacteria bacterium]|nr:hypothetical protein [Gammaproteobacteria bacterium]
MKVELQFQIIFTVNVDKGGCAPRLDDLKPGIVRSRKFRVTEEEVEEPEYQAKHRKYVGYVNWDGLRSFLEDLCPSEVCDTMGALTLEYGLLPAVSFSDGNDGYSRNAYISVIIDPASEEVMYRKLEQLPDNQRDAVVEATIQPFLKRAHESLLQYRDEELDAVAWMRDMVELDVEQGILIAK